MLSQSISTVKGSVTIRRSSATARSGGKRQQNVATPREEQADHQARLRLENGSERCGFTLGDFLSG